MTTVSVKGEFISSCFKALVTRTWPQWLEWKQKNKKNMFAKIPLDLKNLFASNIGHKVCLPICFQYECFSKQFVRDWTQIAICTGRGTLLSKLYEAQLNVLLHQQYILRSTKYIEKFVLGTLITLRKHLIQSFSF